MTDRTEKLVRDIVGLYGGLLVQIEAVRGRDDLFEMGMTSHATVNVMLALEDTFEIEFPEELLSKETFTSITAICSAVHQLATLESRGA